MAVFNTFTFDGENSLDYGVYITGEAVYNAPERAVEMVSIPGKNGDLALDQGRFENIEVTYPAGTFGVEQTEFAGRMRALRNMLASRYNYVRLTDSYYPDEYRLGLYKSGLEASPVAMSSAGEFDITFNCKPQRFLTSGEEPVDTSELGGEVTTDKIPYLFRRSGGGNIGHDFDAEIDKIIGGTVAWNQLVANSGSVSVTVPSGHKYYSNIGGTKAIAISNGSAISATGGTDNIVDLTALFGSAEIADYVYSLEQTTAGAGVAWLHNHGFIDGSYRAFNEGSLLSVKTSEHRTVGRNLLPYPYSDGDSKSNNGITYTVNSDGSINMSGTASADSFFYFNTSSNMVRVANGSGAVRCSVDDSYNPSISGLNFQTDLYVDGVYKRTIQKGGVSYAYNGTVTIGNCRIKITSGTVIPSGTKFYPQIEFDHGDTLSNYEPYRKHSYPLDDSLTLRGIFKLDANNNLYADGDVYERSGAVTRTYRKVTYDGTENWGKESAGWQTSGLNAFYLSLEPYNGKADYINLSNLICDKFINTAYDGLKSGTEYGVIGLTGAGAYMELLADFSSVSDFKTWLASNPITVVYELATPTAEQADPYASQQVVNPLGTEEYIDTRDVPVPVGHETKYGMGQLVLSNPTEFPSKPLLEVTGVGTFWLGDTLFTITGTAGQTIYIDCETGEAWKNVGGVITPANGLVTLNRLDFPELDPGDTPVMYGAGIVKVVVTPRWWII